MKRRVIAVALVGVLLVVVAAVVLPYFVGGIAEGRLKATVSQYNAHDNRFKIKIDAYRRGFYSSQATLSLLPRSTMLPQDLRLWDLMTGRRKALEFKLRIDQGPIAFGGFLQGHVSLVPVLYTVELRGYNLPRASVLGTIKPRAYAKVYFGGASSILIAVPRGHLKWRQGQFAWQAIQVHVTGKFNDAHRDYRVLVTPLRYQVETGENGTSCNGVINGFASTTKQKIGPEDFWIGNTNSRFDGAELKCDGKLIMLFKSGHGHSSLNASDGGRQLDGSSEVIQHGGRIKAWHFTELRIKETVKHVNAAVLRRSIETLRANAYNAQPNPAEFGARLFALERSLEGTQLQATVAITSPHGKVTVDGRMALIQPAPQGVGSADPVNVFLRQVTATVNFSFNRQTVDSFCVQALGGDAVREKVDRQLDAWVHEGLLRVSPNGLYQARVVYRRGIATVNGKAIHGS